MCDPLLTNIDPGMMDGAKWASVQRWVAQACINAGIPIPNSAYLTNINTDDTEGVKWCKLQAWMALLANNISGGGGGAPSGPAGGALAGSYPNPSLALPVIGDENNGLTVTSPARSIPVISSVSNQGTPGVTSYSYQIIALLSNGMMTAPSTAFTTNNGNAVLNATNFNRINWMSYPGAIQYFIYRSASSGTPSSIGVIETSTVTGTTFDDTGLPSAVNIAIPSSSGLGLLHIDVLTVGETSDAQHDYEARVMATGDMVINGAIRAQNQDNFTKGYGIEIQYVPSGSSATGLLHAIDRDTNLFKPILINHGTHDPVQGQVVIGDNGTDGSHMLRVSGSTLTVGLDVSALTTMTATGGGNVLLMDSTNTTGVYLTVSTSSATVGLIGCADVVNGGLATNLALDAHSGQLRLATGGTDRVVISSSQVEVIQNILVDGSATVTSGIETSTISASGLITSTKSGGVILAGVSATTQSASVHLSNTGNDFYLGIEDSTGGTFGATAYAGVFYGSTELDVVLSGAVRARFRPDTGLTIVGLPITTGSPASGTAAAWKFGISSATVPSGTSGCAQIDIAGSAYQIPTGPVPLIRGLDNRAGLTSGDGSAIVLFTTVNGNSLFRVTADIFATSAVTGTAIYTISWTQNSTTQTLVVNSTTVNTLSTATDLINPDNGTNITCRLTGSFTGTFTVAGLVEQIK